MLILDRKINIEELIHIEQEEFFEDMMKKVCS